MESRLTTLARLIFSVCLWQATHAMAAKEKWLFGETEFFSVASDASQSKTMDIVEELHLVRAVFLKAFPNFADKANRRIRVVICRNERTMEKMAPLYNGKPKKLGGMFFHDFEGDCVLIDAEGDFERSKRVVYHEYVHYLTRDRGVSLPRWLSEGLAEVYSTIQPTTKNRVEIGRAPGGRVMVLRERKLIPLQRLFRVTGASPEYNSSDHGRGVFYAESWALVHYLMFGSTDLPKDGFPKLVRRVIADGIVEESDFESYFGIGFADMEKRLRRYVNNGRYTLLKMERPEIEGFAGFELRKGAEKEASLVIGRVRLTTRGGSAAAGLLMEAYDSLPYSAEAAAALAFLDYKNERFDAADRFFTIALERGSESPATRIFAASARMRNVKGKGHLARRDFDIKMTSELLTLLFEARERGESRPELYYRIGEAWLGSKQDPNEGHLGVLVEGVQTHPDDARIGFYLALLSQRIGMSDEAMKLVNHYMSQDLEGAALKNFTKLKAQLEKSL